MDLKITGRGKSLFAVLFILVGCLSMAAPMGSGQYYDRGLDDKVDGPGVILYTHADFRGERIFVPAGRNVRDFKRIGWNDRISSIELVDGAYVRVFEHKNYQGDSRTIYKDVIDLVELRGGTFGDWNDKITSIKVMHGRQSNRDYKRDYRDKRGNNYGYDDDPNAPCVFYRHSNQGEPSFVARLGGQRQVGSRWNDKISSVWIKRGYRVTLYEHDYFRGRSLVLRGKHWKGSLYNLKEFGWNDTMSSYRLERERQSHYRR